MAAACTSMEKDHAACSQHVCVRADSQNPWMHAGSIFFIGGKQAG